MERAQNAAQMQLRRVVVERVLTRAYMKVPGMERPSGTNWDDLVTDWAHTLSDIPVSQLESLADRVFRRPPHSFLIGTADLLRRYEEENQPRLAPCAHVLWERTDAPALPEAPVALEIEPAELKRRLGIRQKPSPEDEQSIEAKREAAREELQRFDALLERMVRELNIDMGRMNASQLVDLRAFCRFWLQTRPGVTFTRHAFAPAWNEFLERPKSAGVVT